MFDASFERRATRAGESDYNYFRDYDSSIGRYLKSDPIGLRGGANTYVYALNGPLSVWDAIALTGTSDALASAIRKHALEKIKEIGKDIPGMAAEDAVGELAARVLCQQGVKPFETDKCLRFCTEFVVPIRANFIDTMPAGAAQGIARYFADQQAGGIIDGCTTHCVKRLTELDEEKRKKIKH